MVSHPEVSLRLQQLVNRFGYESVEQALKPLRPPKRSKGRPPEKAYTWKSDREYLMLAKEHWDSAGKPDTYWSALLAAGSKAHSDNPVIAIESYARRFLGHLRDVDLRMGLDPDLWEFACLAADFDRTILQFFSKDIHHPYENNPKEIHRRLCDIIRDDVHSDEVFREMLDLRDILNRRNDFEKRTLIITEKKSAN